MLNKVMIIGRLGRDPELRKTNNGSVSTISVATDESYTDGNGQKHERTEWHRVVVYNKQAENCANYLRKGSLVYVEGSLQTRKWQNQQGQDQYTTEIKAQRVQFLDRKGDNGGNVQQNGGGYQQQTPHGNGGYQNGGQYRAPQQQSFQAGPPSEIAGDEPPYNPSDQVPF